MSVNDFESERFSTPTELPSTEESSEEAPAVDVRHTSTPQQAPPMKRQAWIESPVSETAPSIHIETTHGENNKPTKDVVDHGALNGTNLNGTANSNSDQSETETKSKSGSTSSNSASMPFDSDMNHHANNPLDEVISKMGVTAHEKSLLVAEHE